MTAARLACVACALLVSIAVGPDSLASVTSLRIDSEPGEPLGGGEFHFYTPDDGSFGLPPWPPWDPGAPEEEVQLHFSKPFLYVDAPGSTSWRMWFAAPPGETLAVGIYDDAVQPYGRGPGQPGLQVSADNRGCFRSTGRSTGRFEVKQIAFDPDGVLSRLWATFEQDCGGILRGEVRFNSDVPLELHAPSHRTARVGHPLEFDVQGPGPMTLSATGLPQGATFTDAGGSGRFSWLPEAGQTGSAVWVAFKGEMSDDGATDVVYTRIDAIPDFDDFDHPIPITALPFDSTVYGPVASAAADDPACPAPEDGFPPPAEPVQGSSWYAFTPVEDGGVQLVMRPSSPDASPAFPPAAGLSVHAGERGALEPVACERSLVKRFVAHSGVTYRMMASFTPSAELRLIASALPPAPANDGFDDATVVGALPFSDAIDTTGAMFQSEPRHCIPPPPPPPGTGPGFGGSGSLSFMPPTNVWYAYAPTEDTRVNVDTSGSNYAAQITAFSGPRGALVPLGCDPAQFRFTALAGKTYHVMIAGSPWLHGNDLQVLFTGRPALRIQAAIGAAGALDRRTGTAFVSGTVWCSRPAEIVLQGTLRQDRRRVQGGFGVSIPCDGLTPWSAAVTPDRSRNRPQRFSAEPALAVVRASGVSMDDPDEVAVDEDRSLVVFKTGPLR